MNIILRVPENALILILFDSDFGHRARGAALGLQPGAASQLQKCFFSLSGIDLFPFPGWQSKPVSFSKVVKSNDHQKSLPSVCERIWLPLSGCRWHEWRKPQKVQKGDFFKCQKGLVEVKSLSYKYIHLLLQKQKDFELLRKQIGC